MNLKLFPQIAIAISCTLFSCGGGKEKDVTEVAKKDTVATTPEAPKAKGPVINIQDSLEVNQTVLCLKDSSSTAEGMYKKLSDIYNIKLQETIKAGKLNVMGSPMAWRTMQNGAYFFEAGIPVDKTPNKMGKGMFIKNTGTDSTIVAHYWGPQDQTKSAYDAIDERLVDVKKTKSSSAYEIYRGDYFPATNEAVDFYKLQTDIIVPLKKVKYKVEKEVPLLKTWKPEKTTKVVKPVKKKKVVAAPVAK